MNRATVRVRCFLEPAGWAEGEVRLSREESHHLLRVRRHEAGQPVEVFDGTGRSALGRLDRMEGPLAVLRIGPSTRDTPRGPLRILAQAAIKGDRADLLVRASVELGLDRMIWFQGEHSVVRPPAARAARKIARWRSIAIEAAKQCGRSRVPEMVFCGDVAEALRAAPSETAWFLCSLGETASPAREVIFGRLSKPTEAMAVGIAVGPEGDFTPQEEAQWTEAGATCISLGPRILRSETAGIVAMALMACALD